MADQNLRVGKKLLFAWLLAGSLDILAAFADVWFTYHADPDKVLIAITRGAFGKEFDAGHFPMMLLGLGIHFVIAGSYTLFFYFVYRFLKNTFHYELLIGFLYGIFTWGTMRFLVLPLLSQVQLDPFQWTAAIKPALILVGTIGIPLSFFMKRQFPTANLSKGQA